MWKTSLEIVKNAYNENLFSSSVALNPNTTRFPTETMRLCQELSVKSGVVQKQSVNDDFELSVKAGVFPIPPLDEDTKLSD